MKFKHIRPTKEYQQAALDYIQEFKDYHSQINGVGGLNRYLDDYDGWLLKLEEDRHRILDDDRVPAETFFLIREDDHKIVGMINIRLALNDKQRRYGGHIGYSIRPTERNKGYNKINLYLGLLCLKQHGVKEALLDCDQDNLASSKTMLAFDAKLVHEYYDDLYEHCIVQDYIIDIDHAISKYKDLYEPIIEKISVMSNSC